MRILNVTQSYAPFYEFGGPPEKIRALSEGLVGLGNEVTVLTADWGVARRLTELPGEPSAEDSPFGKKREVRGVKAIYLPNWLHFRAASWNPALPRYLRARLSNFDVVHIFGLYDLLGARTAFTTASSAAKCCRMRWRLSPLPDRKKKNWCPGAFPQRKSLSAETVWRRRKKCPNMECSGNR